MLTTEVQAQFIQHTIPSLLAIAGNVVAWICDFCDSQWPQLQKRCGSCKRWKGGKRSLSNKKDKQEQTVSKDKEKKRGRKSKMLHTVPTQEVDIPLVVGGASCSPLTGGMPMIVP
jgi:predicted ATP-dependent serine protease